MNEDDGIKVTDRRMFTEDGELREEYREEHELSQGGGSEEEAVSAAPVDPEPGAEAETRSASAPHQTVAGAGPTHHHDLQFMDLVAVLAEPVTLFLGDTALPDGQSAKDLERARLHIDLLQVLREKTEGNLSRDEDAVLADLIYRLRMRYVQERS